MRASLPVSLLALLLILAAPLALLAQEPGDNGRAATPDASAVDIYLFWTATCPHCAKARDFLDRLARREPRVHLRSLELAGEGGSEHAFIALSQRFQIDPPAVPLIVVGDGIFVGYGDDATTGAEIEDKLRACLAKPCTDLAAPVVAEALAEAAAGRRDAMAPAAQPRRPALPLTIRLPGFGDVQTRLLSLPALTILLGAIDGFNPCAMWVLVFLIGLLIGLRDPVRMWSYGAVFLLTSAAVYFVFMAAWLSIFLFLGTLAWIRTAVGVFALAAGAYYMREFMRNPDAACPVTTPGQRQRIIDRLKGAVSERSFVMAILGIMVLAVAVNMVELLCSAGIPAVYTQVLALSDLSKAGYYGYLMLYIAVFMLDDAAIFVAAMLTLQATGLAATYSRYSHLIGGSVLAGIGALLIFRPEWLSFA